MNNSVSILQRLEIWYLSHCNGEWEHQYGIQIGTLDNPGWSLSIDLAGTELEDVTMQSVFVDNGEHDWMHLEISDGKFIGAGDPRKLQCMVEHFMLVAVKHESGSGH